MWLQLASVLLLQLNNDYFIILSPAESWVHKSRI